MSTRAQRGERGTALVTGASGGIGLELAKLSARDGFKVALVARSEDKLAALSNELRESGAEVHVFPADLSHLPNVQDLVSRIRAAGLSIDTLINNAGVGDYGPVADADPETLQRMIQLNVTSLTLLTRLLLDDMVAAKHGRILNVASMAAYQPGPLMSVYYATKAYVLSFSDGLREEVREHGISVTSLCPGPVATGFQDAAHMGRSQLTRFAKPIPVEPVARAGYRGMMRGQSTVIPGLMNRIMINGNRVMPRTLTAKIVKRIQGAR